MIILNAYEKIIKIVNEQRIGFQINILDYKMFFLTFMNHPRNSVFDRRKYVGMYLFDFMFTVFYLLTVLSMVFIKLNSFAWAQGKS